jgi:hypothetical protein
MQRAKGAKPFDMEDRKLGALLGVSDATAFRDVQVLEAAGAWVRAATGSWAAGLSNSYFSRAGKAPARTA